MERRDQNARFFPTPLEVATYLKLKDRYDWSKFGGGEAEFKRTVSVKVYSQDLFRYIHRLYLDEDQIIIKGKQGKGQCPVHGH